MSYRIVRAGLSAALVAGSTALVLSGAAPASAVDLVSPLEIGSFGDIAVAGSTKRIFLSDPTGGKVLVTDYTGKKVFSYDRLPGVHGLVLAKNGDVYAAVPGMKAIVAFDSAGKKLNTYSASGDVKPIAVAEAGGAIWFGEALGRLGRLELEDVDEPDLVPVTTPETFVGTSALAAAGNQVAALDTVGTPGALTVLNVATTPPGNVAATVGAVQDMAFTADGSRLIATGDGLARAMKPADLSTIVNYNATGAGTAVAVNSDGTVAIGVAGQSSNAVSLFAAGSATATKKFALKEAATLRRGGLAWQPGGPRLFGVSSDASGSSYQLQTFGDPAQLVSTVELAVPARLELGKTATISGKFGNPIPAGLPVVVTRKDAAGSRRVNPQTVPANGQFTITDKPTASGTVTYSVALAGNGDFSPVNVTKSFAVGKPTTTTLSLDRNGGIYTYGSTVTFTARLGKTYSSRTVEIWADPFGTDQGNRLVEKATVSSSGLVTASFKLTRNTTLSAVFRGDAFTTARTAKSTVYTKASVATAITRHYKLAKIGTVPYHHLRTTVHPYFTTAIPPYPNRHAYLMIEVFTGTEWKLWQAAFVPLNSTGKGYAELKGTHVAGVKYRVRAAYLWTKSGDAVNYTNYGAYKYFTFTK